MKSKALSVRNGTKRIEFGMECREVNVLVLVEALVVRMGPLVVHSLGMVRRQTHVVEVGVGSRSSVTVMSFLVASLRTLFVHIALVVAHMGRVSPALPFRASPSCAGFGLTVRRGVGAVVGSRVFLEPS